MIKAVMCHDSYPLHTKLLNKLFILVQFLQSLDVHVWQIGSFSLIAVLLVSQNAYGEFWPWESLQPRCWEQMQLWQADTRVHESISSIIKAK